MKPAIQPSASAGGASVRVRRLYWFAMLLLFGGVFAIGVWSVADGMGRAPNQPLPVLKADPIPDFALVNPEGRPVTRADLLGRVWVASFVFSRCAGPCPELSMRMNSIQQSLRQSTVDVNLVTFTLDPKTDTPEVLKAYADRFHADPARWWFLTGPDESSMHRLIREGFLQVVIPATVDAPLTHSEYFVLVDRAGRIRAFYDGREAASKPRILADIDALVGEPFKP